MSVVTNPIRPAAAALVALAVILLTSLGPIHSAAAQSLSDIAERKTREAELLAELATPGLETWAAVEERLLTLWSRSGSDTIDLLVSRARTAIEADDFDTAIEHLTAATDHAPDFAEGWHLRATAFYRIGEYGLAMADLERALALNPNHFGALTGVGIVLEEMGQSALALRAMRAAQRLNPNSEQVSAAVERLRFSVGDATL